MVIFVGNGHSLELYKEFIEENTETYPDIVVSCQYPHKVPKSLIESHTCVNIHYGLLPKYAGCNPVYWQLLLENQIGVTLHYMDDKWDAGDIIDTFTMPCGNLTADMAYTALGNAGLMLLKRHFQGILKGTAPRKPQDLNKRQYFNKKDVNFKREKHLGIVCLDDRKVRAMHFEGKQYPVIRIGDMQYELRRTE